jgi:UDP-glucose 4-epimerase
LNILVTGAGGLIGSKVSRRLLQEGHKVTSIDNFSTGFPGNIPKEVTLIQGDVQDPAIIQNLGGKNFEAILHIAGQSSGEISFDDPVYDLETNTKSTLMLLQYALKTGCKKFVYASSMSVYGNSEKQPVNENTEPSPISHYAVGKLASEHYMRIFSKLGISTTSLRLFNVYGPGQNLKNLRQGMISIYLEQALKNKHIHVKGSGDRFRDFVYIDDVVDAFIKATGFLESDYSVFNIGTGIKTTVNHLINKICNSLENDISVKFEGSTKGDTHGIYACVKNAKNILLWDPKTHLDQGIRKMIYWGLSQNIS